MTLTEVKEENRVQENSQKSYEQKFTEKTGFTFNEFYQKYYHKLVWHIQKFKITELDAEGIASTAMMQGLEKIDKYNPQYHYSTWLFTIGKHLALQYKIDNKKEVLVDTTGDYSEDNNSYQYYLNSKIDNSVEDFESQTITTQKYQETLIELSKLDNKYKEYIELCDIQGKTYDEICEIMDVKLQTVKNRLFHGRLKIQKNTKNKFKSIIEHN